MGSIGDKKRIVVIPRPEKTPTNPPPQQAPVKPVKEPEKTPV